MKDRLLLSIILFIVLGSAMVTSMDYLSYTFKSVFYGIGMIVLVVIGYISFNKYLRKG